MAWRELENEGVSYEDKDGNGRRCDTCAWSQRYRHDLLIDQPEQLECRVDAVQRAGRALVRPVDWCGQWRPKEQVPVAAFVGED